LWIDLLRARGRLEALAAADVVVYPSRDEIFGLVAVEALLCGRPVVVCDDSGCGEVIAALGGGHAVRFGDAEALARAIEVILSQPDSWTGCVEIARRRARELFDANSVCAQLEAVYAEVVAQRGDAAYASA
jgi:glycosyltransferase involved in cell wall biosynthesis